MGKTGIGQPTGHGISGWLTPRAMGLGKILLQLIENHEVEKQMKRKMKLRGELLIDRYAQGVRLQRNRLHIVRHKNKATKITKGK